MLNLTTNSLPKLNVGDQVRLIKTLHSGLDLVSDKVVTVIDVDRLGNFSISGKHKELTHNRFTPDGLPLFKTTGEIQPLSFDSSIAFPYVIPSNTKSIKSVIRSKCSFNLDDDRDLSGWAKIILG